MKKTNKVTISIMLIAAVMIFSAAPKKAHADINDGTLQLGNIIGNAVSTLINSAIRGNINSVKDAAKALIYGSVAGFGFYQSKKMVGNGSITSGVILANISASITENMIRGENPLAYIGYSIGPAKLRIATPLANQPDAIINLDVSPKETINFALALSKAQSVSFKNGLITFEADEAPNALTLGWTYGIFPTVMTGTEAYIYSHEVIHVVQNLQLMALSPYEPLLDGESDDSKGKASLFRFSGFRVDTMTIINDLAFSTQAYEDQWKEIEAHQLAVK